MRRPPWLADAGSKFFKQQSTVGKDRAYGAVGGPHRTPTSSERVRLFGVRELVAGRPDPTSLRILDLGTGDGHILLSLHREFGIPQEHLVGVSAEDMRGLEEVVEVKNSKEPANLREIPEAADSYVVWDIEQLGDCPALAGRKFDVIVSWVTRCWLTDPFGVIELVHDHFLELGGLLVLGSLQLTLTEVAAIDDQVYLAALRDALRKDGHAIDVLRDPVSCVLSWWFQRKISEQLNLYPLITHGELLNDSLKEGYITEFQAGPELEAFSPDRLTVLHGLQVQRLVTAPASGQA